MQKLAICCPWDSEFFFSRCLDSLMNLRHPPGWNTRFFRGRGWSSARRHNHSLEQAFHWGADVVCIVGADQTYQPDMLCRLIGRYESGHQVLAARVPIRGHVANQGTRPFQTLCWRWKTGAADRTREDIEIIGPEHGELVEINGCGSGVLMFPLKALTALTPPWFYETPAGPGFDRKACADWPFVERLQRNANLKVWCDTTIKVGHLHIFEIDETYSERFADWKEGGDSTCCEKEDDAPNVIKQARVSPSIPFYDEKFRKRYGFQPYTTPFLPALFFGCYTKDDFAAIQNHAKTAVVVWAGGDIQRVRKWTANGSGHPPFGKHVRHVAISKFIAADLDALGLRYVRLPLCNVDEDVFNGRSSQFDTIQKRVFAFVPDNDPEKYGGSFVAELSKLLPDYEFVIHTKRDSSLQEMKTIYESCFMGVRPLDHDGLSNTCVELGLLGRTVLWNGDTPNAIPYASVEDAAEKIKTNHRMWCEGPESIINADAMRDFLKLPDGWKTVEFYQPPKLGIIPAEIADQPYEYRSYFDARYKMGPRGAGGPEPGGDEANWTADTIVRQLMDHACESVIEIGCGACVRNAAIPKAFNYTGIDVSPIALRMAAQVNPDATWLLRDIARDDIPEADAVICVDVLQHIKHQDYAAVCDKLVAAARKVLIVKMSADIPELYYQFNHAATLPFHFRSDCSVQEMGSVPDCKVSRMFVVTKPREPVPC